MGGYVGPILFKIDDGSIALAENTGRAVDLYFKGVADHTIIETGYIISHNIRNERERFFLPIYSNVNISLNQLIDSIKGWKWHN